MAKNHLFGALFAAALIACIVILPQGAESVITCADVTRGIAGCINYARGNGSLPPGCCIGVKSLYAAAKTTPDRQMACTCLKTILRGVSGIKEDLAAKIPGSCNVNVGYPISFALDCSKVK